MTKIIRKHNCLPEDKWEELKTPIVITGFNNEGSMITHKAKNIKIQIWDKILTIGEMYSYEFNNKDILIGISIYHNKFRYHK